MQKFFVLMKMPLSSQHNDDAFSWMIPIFTFTNSGEPS
jgi:hypothetical protein